MIVDMIFFAICGLVTTLFATLIIIGSEKRIHTAVVLIPTLYASLLYAVITKAPEAFGYPIPVRYVTIEQAKVINIFESDKIYVTVLEKGKKEPRLVSMESTEQNKKKAQEIKRSVANGMTVVKKSKLGESEGEDGLELVPITEQTIIEKDTE